MAKKKDKKEQQAIEPVANCDQFSEVAANCDHLDTTEADISQYEIEKLIITIRGEQVIIDQDVARLYNVSTKRLNQQANRNSDRFPSNFRFVLTKAERDEVVAKCDHLKSLKYRPSMPYAFTEQGIGQLSSVVHSKKAIETSIKIMNAFVAMRRFMMQNLNVLMQIAHLEKHQIEIDEKIDAILDKMDQNSPKMLPEQIFPTGCVWDAWSYVSDLVRRAKNRIILIDNFVDDRVLSPVHYARRRRFGHHTHALQPAVPHRPEKHNEQYPAIDFIQLSHRNHDRFLIVDNKVHLLGTSLKDMGAGLCAITEMNATPETILALLK